MRGPEKLCKRVPFACITRARAQVMTLVTTVYAILGVVLFGGVDPAHFANFSRSLLTVPPPHTLTSKTINARFYLRPQTPRPLAILVTAVASIRRWRRLRTDPFRGPHPTTPRPRPAPPRPVPALPRPRSAPSRPAVPSSPRRRRRRRGGTKATAGRGGDGRHSATRGQRGRCGGVRRPLGDARRRGRAPRAGPAASPSQQRTPPSLPEPEAVGRCLWS